MAVPFLVGATLVSTALNIAGSERQSRAQAAANRAQAQATIANIQAANFNADLLEQNAVIAAEQGRVAQEAQQRQASRQIGSMIAAYGASGVQVDTGSPLDVLADSARMAELDRLTIGYNTELEVRNYQTQAQLQRMTAQQGVLAAATYNSAARAASTSGYINAGAAALSGLTSMYQSGAFSGWGSAASPSSSGAYGFGSFNAPYVG
jgi:DNA primase